MNLLGLDLGEKRIGVALAHTPTGVTLPLRVLPRRSVEMDGQALASLIREYDIDRVIVGLPLEWDGSEGRQAARVRSLLGRLMPYFKVPVVLYDERLTTREALDRQRRAGKTERQGRPMVDAAAAAVLLSEYLESGREHVQGDG